MDNKCNGCPFYQSGCAPCGPESYNETHIWQIGMVFYGFTQGQWIIL